MRLSSISVSRFRSILDATRVELGDFTVLIGRNNEGKSNFLRALEFSFSALKLIAQDARSVRSGIPNRYRFQDYSWERDYPLSYRDRQNGRRDTTFRLSFDLTDNEQAEFFAEFAVRLSTTLSLEISIGESGSPRIRWAKQGKSAEKLDGRMPQVAAFVDKNFTFLYVPAIRTERESEQIVQTLVRKALQGTSRSQEYINTISRLQEIERPMLEEISANLLPTLQSFLPEIRSVRFSQDADRISTAMRMRSVNILVDDGNETNLSLKGDGIKSIVALALFKHGSPEENSSMLAIEEPEAHLHAGAIHQLRNVLSQISRSSQVVISTHSHAFISRENPKNNIIVHDGKVRQAKSVNEIRDIIGIRASDNLLNSDLVILVEGATDKVIIGKAISFRSKILEVALNTRSMTFDALGGSGKLAYKASSLQRELFPFVVIFDNDDAGRKAIELAIDARTLGEADYKVTTVIGMAESEIEDLVDPTIYIDEISMKYGVTFKKASIPGKGKWSDRLRDQFLSQGKLWSDTTKDDLKTIVSNSVESHDGDPISTSRGGVLDSIVDFLEEKLNSIRS